MGQTQKTRYRGAMIGFVFQAYNLIPTLSAVENVAVPLLILGKKPFGSPEPGEGGVGPRGPGRQTRDPSRPAFRRAATAGCHRQGPGSQSETHRVR